MAKVAKADTVKMRGTYAYADEYTSIEYFYDGELPVVKGQIEVPLNRPEWISRLLATGYEFVGEAPENFRA